MRAWYVPSWTGDFRLEAVMGGVDDPITSMLTVEDPTAGEILLLERFLSRAHDEGWIADKQELAPVGRTLIHLRTSVARAGRVLASDTAPRSGALTAVKSKAGSMLAVVDLERQDEVIEQIEREAAEAAAEANTEEGTKKKEADAAVTTRRATMCCPHPIEGSLRRSSRVLREFCSPRQWREWVVNGWLVAHGSETGNAYRICHRHHPAARWQGRIVYDLDHGCTLHCYNMSVPPPEEVLGIKLQIEYREDSIRNPSGCAARGVRFEHPYGYGGADGIWDTGVLSQIGALARGFESGFFSAFRAGVAARRRSR